MFYWHVCQYTTHINTPSPISQAKGRKQKRNYRSEKSKSDDQSNGGKKLRKDIGANYNIRCSLSTIKKLRDIMTSKQKKAS
jgi:hypothetical protein